MCILALNDLYVHETFADLVITLAVTTQQNYKTAKALYYIMYVNII